MSFIPLLDAFTPIVNKVLGYIPDPTQKLEAENALRTSLQAWDKAQTDVNAVEAANSNVFVSGWRPATGWLCVFAIGWHYICMPIGLWLAAIYSPGLVLPDLSDNTMTDLIFGMLGLGGMRSFERIKGVNNKRHF